MAIKVKKKMGVDCITASLFERKKVRESVCVLPLIIVFKESNLFQNMCICSKTRSSSKAKSEKPAFECKTQTLEPAPNRGDEIFTMRKLLHFVSEILSIL